MGKPIVRINPIPVVPPHLQGMTDTQYTKHLGNMAQRLAEHRQRLQAERAAQDRADTSILNTAAVIGALNDLTPSDPTPSDFTGAGGGLWGGGGASGDF